MCSMQSAPFPFCFPCTLMHLFHGNIGYSSLFPYKVMHRFSLSHVQLIACVPCKVMHRCPIFSCTVNTMCSMKSYASLPPFPCAVMHFLHANIGSLHFVYAQLCIFSPSPCTVMHFLHATLAHCIFSMRSYTFVSPFSCEVMHLFPLFHAQ